MQNIKINNDIIKNLNECISYVNEKNSNIQYPNLSNDDKESIDFILLEHYRESKIIALSYREKGKIKSYVGIIDRIDLIHKEIFLIPKKRISFSMIVGLKNWNI